MQVADDHAAVKDSIAALGESVVVVEDESILKVHIHSPDPDQLRGRLGSFGDIVHWSAAQIDQGSVEQSSKPAGKTCSAYCHRLRGIDYQGNGLQLMASPCWTAIS